MEPSLRHRLINWGQSALLLAGMALIAWACTAAVAGPGAALWVLAGLSGLLLLAPSAPKEMFLRAYGARRLGPRDFPFGHDTVAELARQARLERAPVLYYIPSSAPNAFAVGTPSDSALAVSDGLIRMMSRRELRAVFAHEIAHVANRDLWIMGLADVMARATALLSYAGQFLLIVNLPLLLFGAVTIPWIVPVVLIFAPTGMSLLQLALSRAREFDADRAAAELTGDPMGLAAALGRLERRPGRFWEEILLPGRRMPEPSVLRTHPRTEQRIERLEELARERRQRGRDGEGGRRDRRDGDGGADIPVRIVPVRHPPRLRWTGVWY